jgi:hypothetical protein
MSLRSVVFVSALLMTPLAASVQAADDWPASVVCALADPTVCTPEGCREITLETLDLPWLIRIDLETGVMHAPTPRHSGRRSAFTVIERSEAKIVMQGYENGRAFSAVLDEPGTLAISAAIDGTTASIFALCTDLAFVTQPVDEGMERKED